MCIRDRRGTAASRFARRGLGRVLLTVADSRTVHLVLNFVASARRLDADAGLLVIAADAAAQRILQRARVPTFRHAALGDVAGGDYGAYGGGFDAYGGGGLSLIHI